MSFLNKISAMLNEAEADIDKVGDANTKYYVVKGRMGDSDDHVLSKAMSKKECDDFIDQNNKKHLAIKNMRTVLADKGTEIWCNSKA